MYQGIGVAFCGSMSTCRFGGSKRTEPHMASAIIWSQIVIMGTLGNTYDIQPSGEILRNNRLGNSWGHDWISILSSIVQRRKLKITNKFLVHWQVYLGKSCGGELLVLLVVQGCILFFYYAGCDFACHLSGPEGTQLEHGTSLGH